MRRETVAERAALIFELYDFGVQLKAAQLRRAHPRLSERQLRERLERWLLDKPPPGVGLRVRPWPPAEGSSARSSTRSRRSTRRR